MSDQQKPEGLNGALALQIYRHWEKYRPNMAKDLQAKGKLVESVNAAARLTSDAMYQATTVEKQPYDQAWERLKEDWAFLPDEKDQPSLPFAPEHLSSQVPEHETT